MTLLELLRQELPKRGGWPEGADYVVQDGDGTNDIKFGAGEPSVRYDCDKVWRNDELSDWGINTFESHIRDITVLADDHATAIITREQYEVTSWDGTGLPPVGCECEYMKHTRSTGNNWSKGTVKYISEYTVVIDDDDVDGEFIAHPLGCAFRPLRTEAERAIDEMVRLSGVSIGAAKILYDAGYRKG